MLRDKDSKLLDEKIMLRDEKSKLLDEKIMLRDKESKLLDKKIIFRDEMSKLLDKEIKLRDNIKIYCCKGSCIIRLKRKNIWEASTSTYPPITASLNIYILIYFLFQSNYARLFIVCIEYIHNIGSSRMYKYWSLC